MRGVASGGMRQTRNELIGEFRMKTSQSAFFISQRPTHDCFYFFFIQRISTRTRLRESKALVTSNDGFSVVAPIRVTVPFSTAGSSASLLRFVEAMNFIDEQNRAATALTIEARFRNRGSQIFDAGKNRRRAMNRASVFFATAAAKVVLPVPGGPHRIIRRQRPAFRSAAAALARSHQMFLSDKFGQGTRRHSISKGAAVWNQRSRLRVQTFPETDLFAFRSRILFGQRNTT